MPIAGGIPFLRQALLSLPELSLFNMVKVELYTMTAKNFQLGSHSFHSRRMDIPGQFLETHRVVPLNLLIKF